MVYLTFCRGLQGKVTPTLAWAIWQHLNGAGVIVMDVKAACAMKEPQWMLLWLPKGSTNRYCQGEVHLQLKVENKREWEILKNKNAEMLASDRFLACLLNGGHVSLVWVQSDSQFASATNVLQQMCCYKSQILVFGESSLSLDWVYQSNIHISMGFSSTYN